MSVKRATSKVFFDDEKIVVATSESGKLSWHVVLEPSVDDAELGGQVLRSWDLFEVGDPDAPTHRETTESWAPIRELFGVEWHMEIRQVVANRARIALLLLPTEWRAYNRETGAAEFRLPLDAGALAVGAAVRDAMELTDSSSVPGGTPRTAPRTSGFRDSPKVRPPVSSAPRVDKADGMGADTLDELVAALVSAGVLDADTGERTLRDGVPEVGAGRFFEVYGILDEQGGPHFWWTRSLEASEWWFTFFFDTIADTQVTNLLDDIAPAVAELGVDLRYDWKTPQPDDRDLDDLALRINEEPVPFQLPSAVGCLRPLATVNELLAAAGADRRFYFSGVQWHAGHFFNDSMTTVLLPISVADVLATTAHVVDAARPYLVEKILESSTFG